MKKLLIGAAFAMILVSPASAWYDGYGNYHCTYLDPLTSFLDGIFGQPCYAAPPPTVVVQAPPVVVQAPPVVVETPVYVDRPVPVPVPQPYAVPVPAPYPVPVYPYPY